MTALTLEYELTEEDFAANFRAQTDAADAIIQSGAPVAHYVEAIAACFGYFCAICGAYYALGWFLDTDPLGRWIFPLALGAAGLILPWVNRKKQVDWEDVALTNKAGRGPFKLELEQTSLKLKAPNSTHELSLAGLRGYIEGESVLALNFDSISVLVPKRAMDEAIEKRFVLWMEAHERAQEEAA
ncbi:MAG: hypothetical protein AAGF13_08635 [Pseudomonadota bacterium]